MPHINQSILPDYGKVVPTNFYSTAYFRRPITLCIVCVYDIISAKKEVDAGIDAALDLTNVLYTSCMSMRGDFASLPLASIS